MRKLVAAVVGTIAAFVMLFGLGMTSWTIFVLGAAMLALAVSLALINMVRRDGRAWVAGTAHVVSASEPPASSDYGRCELQIVVAAPGLPASAVKVRDPRVPVEKWPDAGATLPVMVAVDDMRHVRVLWEDVLTHTEAMAEPPAYVDPLHDLTVDDLLPEPQAPPWVTRDRGRPQRTGDTALAGDTLHDANAPTVLTRRRPSPYPHPRPEPSPQPAAEQPAEQIETPAAATATEPDLATATAAAPARTAAAAADAPRADGTINGFGSTILVTDLQRSTAFYHDLLGFSEIDSGNGSAVLASGATRLVLRT
ncbi:MAG TPA: VOC family protein, partial [Actinoplanes sp.]|nr:VOC family protein [Actinoplanes sp.]